MNCKPGDLAIIIRGRHPGSKTGLHLGPSGLSAVHGVPDAWMRPIRDQPGADETLEWAPVPALDVPDTAPAAPAETPEPEEVPA